MAIETINAVKEIEIKAEDIKEKAHNSASSIIEKAKREASAIIDSKIKEATAKSDLRINFAKNEAKEHIKKKSLETNNEILVFKAIAKEKGALIQDLIIKEIVGD